MDMMLKGKRAFITGSTSGIGAQCARVLAGEGVSVVINGRNADRAAAVAEEIRASGGEAEVALGDVTTEEGSRAVIESAKSAFDGIDILVNNVGNPTRESHLLGLMHHSRNGSTITIRTRSPRFDCPCLCTGNEGARLGAFDPSLLSERYLAACRCSDLRCREGRAEQHDPQSFQGVGWNRRDVQRDYARPDLHAAIGQIFHRDRATPRERRP
jgi:short chain dehydrogenase